MVNGENSCCMRCLSSVERLAPVLKAPTPPGSSEHVHAFYCCSLWWACQSCHGSKARREHQAQHLQPPVADLSSDTAAADIQDWFKNLGLLLTLPPGGSLQLAVLRCGVRYAHRMLGYLHALSAADQDRPPLLRGALVCWDEAAVDGCDAAELAASLDSLITYLRKHNPAVQRYLTMAEQQWGTDQVRHHHTADPVHWLGYVACGGAVVC